MNRESWIFCLAVLAAALVLSTVGFSLAAMPRQAVEANRKPAPAETLPDVDLGPGFGKVAVLELMGYYLENPPAPAGGAAGASPAVKRFGGC